VLLLLHPAALFSHDLGVQNTPLTPRGHSIQPPPSGNLGDNINESELRGMMSFQQGYRQMKVVKGPRSTTGEKQGFEMGDR